MRRRTLLVAGGLSLLTLTACRGHRRGAIHVGDTELEGYRHRIVLEALGQVGRPYRWGGTTPDGFDCSGLVQYVYAQTGLSMPRTAREQHELGAPIGMGEAEPGDLLFYSFAGRKVDHVAIYLGDDQAVHAPAHGRAVIVASVHLPFWKKHFVDAVRILY